MERILNPDLSINRAYRPYVNMEEYDWSTSIYDPNGTGKNFHLYDREWPPCNRWLNSAYRDVVLRGNRPGRFIDKNGQNYIYANRGGKPQWIPY